MNNTKIKIEQLKEEIINNNTINYNYLIVKLLNKGTLNNIINHITEDKTKINVTTLHKREYLSGNEQFLDVLSKFIYIFKDDFYFLNNNFDSIVELLLQNDNYNKFLLCKKYIGNNKYMPYFSFNFRRLIVCGFYNNLNILAKESSLINKFVNDNKICLKTNLLDCKKGLKLLYDTLLKISVCNAKEMNAVLLFEDINHYIEQSAQLYKVDNKKVELSIQKYYVREWEEMIKNYYRKLEATNILLK